MDTVRRLLAVVGVSRLVSDLELVGDHDTARGRLPSRRRWVPLHLDVVLHHPFLTLGVWQVDGGDMVRTRGSAPVPASAPAGTTTTQWRFVCPLRRANRTAE